MTFIKIKTKNRLDIKFLLIIILQLYVGCESNPVHGKNGMVVSTNHHASRVGIDIMKMDGNAVDDNDIKWGEIDVS